MARHIDWDNTVVTGISGIEIEMPTKAKIWIFTNNDLRHISDHFEINLAARLLNQIHVVPTPPPRYDYYDDPQDTAIEQLKPSTLTGATVSAPPFSFTVP